jgi:hypothetical protein
VWVRKQLDQVTVSASDVTPQSTVVIADTTFWGRHYGVCVFRSSALKKNLWWHEVSSELMAHYHYAKKILEEKGWSFTAAVVDGRRGLVNVFKDIPVQMCQFHQIKIVIRYITTRPRTEAGKELLELVLTLAKTNEETFTAGLTTWHSKWGSFINEKTVNTFLSGKTTSYHTHKGVYSAYHSLKRNLPHLFIYQKYPLLNIPNTTNDLDGSFSNLKKKLSAHHGLRRDRRFKVISEILRDRS